MQRMTLGLSAALLLLAGPARAADDQSAAPETRAEAQAGANRLFDKLDLNHDGKLDEVDRAARASRMSERPDANHDQAGEPADAGHGEGHMDGHHMGEGHMGHWGYDHREMAGLVMLILHRADPGHSGTVSHDDFVAAALALFDQADTNHDGVLTPEEHLAAAVAMHQRMHLEGAAPPPGN